MSAAAHQASCTSLACDKFSSRYCPDPLAGHNALSAAPPSAGMPRTCAVQGASGKALCSQPPRVWQHGLCSKPGAMAGLSRSYPWLNSRRDVRKAAPTKGMHMPEPAPTHSPASLPLPASLASASLPEFRPCSSTFSKMASGSPMRASVYYALSRMCAPMGTIISTTNAISMPMGRVPDA